jgi:hypothetical protein
VIQNTARRLPTATGILRKALRRENVADAEAIGEPAQYASRADQEESGRTIGVNPPLAQLTYRRVSEQVMASSSKDQQTILEELLRPSRCHLAKFLAKLFARR